MKYRKKPVVIEAVQFNANDTKELFSWIEPGLDPDSFKMPMCEQGTFWWKQGCDPGVYVLMVPTLESPHEARHGDYIIRGVQGEYYPCKPDIFEQTYEPVGDLK